MKQPVEQLNTFAPRYFDYPILETEDDDDIQAFQRELKITDPDQVRHDLEKALPWDRDEQMWVLADYSEFTGTLADRANADYFQLRYPHVVTTVAHTKFGRVTTGISRKNLLNFDTDTLFAILQDADRAQKEGALDQAKWKQLQTEARFKAWKEWAGSDFRAKIIMKFHDADVAQVLTALRNSQRMYPFFEQARDKSGEEWSEHAGGEMTINVDPIVDAVTPQMMRRFLDQAAQQQHESLMEAKKFSCVMAPAPAEIADAVIRWGQMFVTDDELYIPESDPEGFGREKEVHVTVKFGLHDGEPSPDLLRIIEETQPFEIEIGPCTLFENEEFDVVKFDVDSDALRDLNARISKLPNSDSHPEYSPHITVAYVTKGACHDLIGKPLLESELQDDVRFLVKSVLFSSKTGKKPTLFLGKPNLESEAGKHLLKRFPNAQQHESLMEAFDPDEEEAMDIETAKEIYGNDFKRFTDADIEANYSDFPVIHAEPEDLMDAPMRKQQQQHPSGFGPQVGPGLKICFNGRLYRLHVWDHGDHSSVWFKANKRRIFLQ